MPFRQVPCMCLALLFISVLVSVSGNASDARWQGAFVAHIADAKASRPSSQHDHELLDDPVMRRKSVSHELADVEMLHEHLDIQAHEKLAVDDSLRKLIELSLAAHLGSAHEVSSSVATNRASESHLRHAERLAVEVSPDGIPTKAEASSPASDESRCSSCKCAFSDQFGNPADCDAESSLRLLVNKWMPSSASVIEFGAKYGSTSCAIAKRLNDSGHLIAVEPDSRVWTTLENNRMKNDCNFSTVQGFTGQAFGGYDAQATKDTSRENSLYNMPNAPHWTLGAVQEQHGFRVRAAVFNCGCLADLVKSTPELFPQLELIFVAELTQQEREAMKAIQRMGDFTEIDRVQKYSVFRRGCGASWPCKTHLDLVNTIRLIADPVAAAVLY